MRLQRLRALPSEQRFRDAAAHAACVLLRLKQSRLLQAPMRDSLHYRALQRPGDARGVAALP